MSAADRKRGEAYLDLEDQAEQRLRELQSPPRRREEGATLSNPVAEAAIIAGLVNCGDPAAIGRYALEHRLNSELFTIPAYRAAYAAITDLAADGQPVDVPILAQRMAHEDLAAVDSACREHVSAANFTHYARILAGCKQRRAVASARDRLAQAANADAPDHELARLFEAVRAASAGDSSDKTAPPPWKSLDLDTMRAARLHPRCIVEYQLYADLAVMNAEGGTGKTTLLLYEAIHIALRRDLWGCRVLNPGRTLFITAEDGEELLQARLREVMTALNLTDYERQKVCENVMFWDVTGSLVRLAELDARGNLQLTALADRIVETYRDAGLVQVIFDPAIIFSPGERIVNDGEQAIVTACRRIIRGLNCCVRLIHHSGQSNAREGAIDQYAGRGGTALPDGARMVTILASANRVKLARPEGFDLQPGESGFVMARAKLSYAPPQPNIWIRRRGWTFEYVIETPRNAEAVRDHDADKVAKFLTEEFHHGRRYTANTLEQSGKTGLSRSRLRAALATLETNGRVTPRDLPLELRQGGRKKHYLHCAKDSGAIAAETPPEQPTPPPIAPDISIAPPYRETRNGAIDAVLVSPGSLNCAKQSGAIAAQWRNSDESADADALEAEGRRLLEESKTALSEVQILPSGEIIGGDVPAPGTRLDLRNRGNRLFQQARALRLAEAEKRERPPEEPGISPDIASASQAETQSATDTWADKTPDTPRDNPRQPTKPLSPLDGDITRYLRNVSGTATEDEVHRQTSHGKAGRTPAMIRIALAKLVAAGVVDKINGQYRLAGGARS